MSYEGSVQLLCKHGHLTNVDCNEDISETLCDEVMNGQPCNAEFVFMNSVNETNCDEDGEIPLHILKTLVVAPREWSKCAHCDCSKVINDTRYRIPEDHELDKLRHVFIDPDWVSYADVKEYVAKRFKR